METKKELQTVVTATPDNTGNITINKTQLRLMAVDRTPKDIAALLQAIEYAESVYHPNRSELYDIYTQIKIDPFLSGIIEKRISSVLNKEIYFQTADGEEVEAMEPLINSKEFRAYVKEIMLTKFWGLTGIEFIPGKTFAFNCIPRKHIRPNSRIVATDEYGTEGFGYEGVWNIIVMGNWDDLGLLLNCAPVALLKKAAMGDYAQYIEIFGQPVMVFSYDAFDEKTKIEMDTMMRNMGGSVRISKPKQAEIELMDGKQANGSGELQEKFIMLCNNEMAVRILGATETTASSSSSGYAQSKEHGKQQDEIIKDDMVDVRHALNDPQFITVLKSYGFPADSGEFWFRDDVDMQEIKTKLEIAAIVDKKTPVDDDYFYDVSGVTKPDNYDALKAERKAAQPAINDNDNDDNPDADPADTKPGKKKKAADADEEEPEDLKASSLWKKFKSLFR